MFLASGERHQQERDGKERADGSRNEGLLFARAEAWVPRCTCLPAWRQPLPPHPAQSVTEDGPSHESLGVRGRMKLSQSSVLPSL